MKKYVVVSTYPESGSKNIGDQLITNALVESIRYRKGADVDIKIIWREANWNDVKSDFIVADVIIFACLAIRPHMDSKEYPYLSELLALNLPLAVISAGTALNVSSTSKTLFDYVSEDTKYLLKELAKQTIFFSTRGYLTQTFCKKIGMCNTHFSGDIAFFNENKEIKRFPNNKNIKKIVISDPHYASDYLSSFNILVEGIKGLFPGAQIVIALHGNDQTILNYAIEKNIRYECIFENKNEGLSIYDKADLHVGYRVHAHVSSLKRGMYSYLLEQDGRGCDYGLSIERKISVPCYRFPKTYLRRVVLRVASVLKLKITNVSNLPAEQILSLIEQDKNFSFNKFEGLELQISSFIDNILEDIDLLP